MMLSMAWPGVWIAVDIVGTHLSGEVFVHSAAGDPIARPLRECADQLGLTDADEAAFRAVVEAALTGHEILSGDGIVVETHRIDAADGTPVGLIVWADPRPPTARPVYNAWVFDVAGMTSRTSGDNPGLIGDGRAPGEERHIQHLFTWLNPEDASSWMAVYYDAHTGVDGTLLQLYWSLRPGGREWVHLWSSCRLRVSDSNHRMLYGLTVELASREVESAIAPLVQFSRATLLLVEAGTRTPITTVGSLAPLGESRIAQVLDQVDLEKRSEPGVFDSVEQDIRIDGVRFTASTMALTSVQGRRGAPVAVVLVPGESGAQFRRPDVADLATGADFAGYLIQGVLGRGGMGTVYLARHPRLPRLDAVKVLNANHFGDRELGRRFEREAHLAGQLDHPNIVKVYDCGEWNGRLWFSMQYLDGVTTACGPMPSSDAVHIITEVARALDYAHSVRGLLHRDVKPANILLAQGEGASGGRVLLGDFGIAKAMEDDTSLTRSGVVLATLEFASPEQIDGVPLDHRTDVYSLGCTFFQLLTGLPPYPGGKPSAVIAGHLYETPPPVSGIRPELPTALDMVFARVLAKRPGDRYDTCTDFASAARQAIDSGTRPISPALPDRQDPVASAEALSPTAPNSAVRKRIR